MKINNKTVIYITCFICLFSLFIKKLQLVNFHHQKHFMMSLNAVLKRLKGSSNAEGILTENYLNIQLSRCFQSYFS